MAINAASLLVTVGGDVKGALSGLKSVQKAVGGFGGSLGGIAKDALGVFSGQALFAGLQAAPGFLADALGLNVAKELEETRAMIQAITKDVGQTESILAAVRAEADATPFGFAELASATAALLPISKALGLNYMDALRP